MDVKKIGKIPRRRRLARRPATEAEKIRRPNIGYDYVQCLVDDHSGLAYSEILTDETGTTCAAFLLRAAAWIADIGNNECDRDDTAVLRLREPDPVRDSSAPVVASYRYRFSNPPGGPAATPKPCSWSAPHRQDHALHHLPLRAADPSAVVTLEQVATPAGPGGRPPANLSGADLSSDQRLLAVRSHTRVFLYQARDPAARGQALVADLIARPPRWTISLGHNANVEGIAFGYRSHDLHLLAENGNLYLVAADAYAR
jgi:hypothetical protein